MKQYSLQNGLTVIEKKTPTNSLTIQLTVNVGSNDEAKGISGISHFIEHMVFEGTKKRKDAKEISNEIESVGGDLNAYTDNTKTCFYIKVPKKHAEVAIDILADMIINPRFDPKLLEKERQVILKEINIFNDESRYYQWVLFSQTVFTKHPSRIPAYGTRKDVEQITREQMIDFYKQYYTAKNAVLTVVGNLPNSNLIKKHFGSMKEGTANKRTTVEEPTPKKPKTKTVKRKLMNSYMVLGYKTVERIHKDSYVLDVIQGILGRGQSGKLFDEIRNKRGLAYEVSVHHDPDLDIGMFAVSLSADKKKLPLIKKLILKEFNNLGKLSTKELKEAKGYLEGKYILDAESTHHVADEIADWARLGYANLETNYLKNLKKVTKADIKRVAKKYLTKNYTAAIIEQK